MNTRAGRYLILLVFTDIEISAQIDKSRIQVFEYYGADGNNQRDISNGETSFKVFF